MKRQLSLALLTISIFSLNVLPVKAVGIDDAAKTVQEKDTFNVVNGIKGCVMIPEIGFFCW